MPDFDTKHFGRLPYRDADVIEFAAGLPGFEHERRFLPVLLPNAAPLVMLQSLATLELCFITAPVFDIDPQYRLAMAHEDLRAIGLPEGREPVIGVDVLCLVVVTLAEGQAPTANLLAPLVVNAATRQGVQAILADSGYSHQYVLESMAAEPACL